MEVVERGMPPWIKNWLKYLTNHKTTQTMLQKMKLITMVLCCCGLASYAQTTMVLGNITGLKANDLVVHYYRGDKNVADTIKVKAGRFKWITQMAEPQKVTIMFPNRFVEFFAESGTIHLKGTVDSLQNLKVTGSKVQDESDAYDRSLKDLSSQEMPLYQKYGKVSKEEQVALEQKLEVLRGQKRERANQYIASHPKSAFSVSLVADRAAMGSYQNVADAFSKLDPVAQKSEEGKRISERLVVLKRSAIGEPMLNFTQNDAEGKPVKFADFKGKYVLVDFWASWCGPCRAENPNVLKAYNLYKDKNFTVLGVSLDDKGENWKKAIKDDAMPWTQVSDLKGWNNEVSTYYGIRGIPSTLLIDPNGKIIAKDLRGEILNKKLEELFN
jgi:thiol-disulfide isomerase/thioredoxin